MFCSKSWPLTPLLLAIDLVELQNTCKKQKNAWKTQHMLYLWKDGGSRMSNIIFPRVNPIQLSPSPFNSSPQCRKLFMSSFQANFLKMRFTNFYGIKRHLTTSAKFFIQSAAGGTPLKPQKWPNMTRKCTRENFEPSCLDPKLKYKWVQKIWNT